MKPPSTKSKSFFDYSTREKKRILLKAAKEGAKMQRELMEKAIPSREKWSDEFDKEFQYFGYRPTVKSFIRSLLARQKQAIHHDLTKIFKKHKTDPMTGNVVLLELDVYLDNLSDAGEGRKGGRCVNFVKNQEE